MKKRRFLIGLMFITILLSGCAEEPAKPKGALSVAELLADPGYDTPIEVY